MKIFLIITVCLVAIFLETTFISLPFVLISLLLLGVIFKEAWIFPAAFLSGIFLDMLSFRAIGVSSLFFILMLGGIFLYQRKFEIQSIFFVGISTLIISFINLSIFGSINSFLEALISTLFAFVVFYIVLRLHTPSKSSGKNALSF